MRGWQAGPGRFVPRDSVNPSLGARDITLDIDALGTNRPGPFCRHNVDQQVSGCLMGATTPLVQSRSLTRRSIDARLMMTGRPAVCPSNSRSSSVAFSACRNSDRAFSGSRVTPPRPSRAYRPARNTMAPTRPFSAASVKRCIAVAYRFGGLAVARKTRCAQSYCASGWPRVAARSIPSMAAASRLLSKAWPYSNCAITSSSSAPGRRSSIDPKWVNNTRYC